MKNRKLKLIIAGILLIALAAPAAAIAYFTDYEEAHGGAVLHLEGETHIDEQPDDAGKTIKIVNTGKTDVIVRLMVVGEFIKEPVAKSGWTKDGDYWYWDSILKPGAETATIRLDIDVDAAKEAGHDFDIVVLHESERVSYEQVTGADGKVKNKVVKPEGWSLPDILLDVEEVGD